MFRRFKGQAALLFVIALPALLGGVALCTDVAVLYFNWAQLQKAADSAALAGANFLPDDTTDAVNTATSYATSNGIQNSEITGTTISSDSLSLTVSLSRTVPYYFARVLGLTTGTVNASGTATLRNVPLARGLIPIGIGCPPGNCGYNNKQVYHLKYTQVGNGNWGALALGANGASNYRQSMMYGYIGPINAGDMVPTETGNIVVPTGQAISSRVSFGQSLDPGMDQDSAPAYDPRFVVVPMVDFSTANGKSDVQVMGFAKMWIVDASGNNNTIDAMYLGTVPEAPTAYPGMSTSPVLTK